MNLDNRYSHRLTDLLSNESAIPPISPDIEYEEITTVIILPKKPKNIKRTLMASKLLFPRMNSKPKNRAVIIQALWR
jgi:hypothetical protein